MWDTDLGISNTTVNKILTKKHGSWRNEPWEKDGALLARAVTGTDTWTTCGHEPCNLGKHLVQSNWGRSVVTPWGKARRPTWLLSQESAGWWTGQGTQTWKGQDGIWPCRPSEVKVAQPCPILCNPTDYAVPWILQARILGWVAFPFSMGSPQPRDRTQVSRTAGGCFTSWATREPQEYWSG